MNGMNDACINVILEDATYSLKLYFINYLSNFKLNLSH